MKKLSGILFLLILRIGSLSAAQYDYYWYTFGCGPASIDGPGRVGSVLRMSHQLDHRCHSIRTLLSTRPNSEELFEKAWEFAYLEGWSVFSNKSIVQLTAGAGLGLSGITLPDKKFKAFGIPVETQLYFRINRSFGLGLYGYAHFNFKQNLYGLLFSLNIGKNLNK